MSLFITTTPMHWNVTESWQNLRHVAHTEFNPNFLDRKVFANAFKDILHSRKNKHETYILQGWVQPGWSFRALPQFSPHECGISPFFHSGLRTFPQKQKYVFGTCLVTFWHPGQRHPVSFSIKKRTFTDSSMIMLRSCCLKVRSTPLIYFLLCLIETDSTTGIMSPHFKCNAPPLRASSHIHTHTFHYWNYESQSTAHVICAKAESHFSTYLPLQLPVPPKAISSDVTGKKPTAANRLFSDKTNHW